MKLDLRIAGMTCLDCARRLEAALAAVPGVERVQVNYVTKHATVLAVESVEVGELLEAVNLAGYRAETEEGGEPVRTLMRTGAVERGDGNDRLQLDLLVIGSGAAGMAAAIRASELGATVAIAEAGVVGGTCVNVGCIPSKNLIEAAQHYHTARTRFPGIGACEPQVAWAEVVAQKKQLVETLRKEKYLDVIDAYEGITLMRGRTAFVNGGVRVGDTVVNAKKFVIATGTRPAIPNIPGLAEVGALDSTSAMELEQLPSSMIVIGGGSIGLELGQMFARFGVKLIILEAAQRILPAEDVVVADTLREALAAEGIEFHTGIEITNVARDVEGYRVQIRDGNMTGEVNAEQLLVAAGRRANTDELGLAVADVRLEPRGFVKVNEFMRTSNPDVFAAGDVTGGPGFVYVAALAGGIAAQAALGDYRGGKPIPIDLTATPRITFTDPQAASVGMTEAEAREAGYSTKVSALPMEYLPRALVSYRTRGVAKIVADASSDRLLGVHIVSSNAGDVIGEAVVAVKFGLRVQDIVSTLHPYLTWAEAVKLAAQTFTTDVAKLSCCA